MLRLQLEAKAHYGRVTTMPEELPVISYFYNGSVATRKWQPVRKAALAKSLAYYTSLYPSFGLWRSVESGPCNACCICFCVLSSLLLYTETLVLAKL